MALTAVQKTDVAAFLDAAADWLGTGYREERAAYAFEDDAAPEPPAAADSLPAAADAEDSLEAVAADSASCCLCALGRLRKQAVAGEGAASPLVLVVGEAPAEAEEACGRPFAGQAGQLLDKMLAAINLFRERNCFLTCAVRCRPPADREPSPQEAAACEPLLARQIALLRPEAILCVGPLGAQALLRTDEQLDQLRGRFFEYHGAGGPAIPLVATYHPNTLLRDETLKRLAWEDLKRLRDRLPGAR